MEELSDEWWEFVSYTFGCLSVLIWIGAQLPQILKNWRKKSVEGLSPGFLAAWIAGDASNLAGCLLTGQLGVQILLASYFCFIDVVLIAQFMRYKEQSPDVLIVHGYDPYADEDTHDNSNHVINKPRTKSMVENIYMKLGSVLSTTSLAGRSSAAPVAFTPPSTTIPASLNSSSLYYRSIIASLPLVVAVQERDWATSAGYLIAYFSMCMYLTSRVPQIYHNYQRKSTTGISMLLFIFALMGNLTYILSIVLSPQCIGKNADTLNFLVKEASYILGALGTIIFDFVILGQWHWYQRVYPRRRRSTAPLDRIQRPYLGTPRPSVVVINCSTPTILPQEPLVGSPPSLSLLNDQTRSPNTYGSTDETAIF